MQKKSLFITAFAIVTLIALSGIYGIVGQSPPDFNCPAWSYGDILSNPVLRASVEKYDSDNNRRIDYSEHQSAYNDHMMFGVITREEYCAVKVFYEHGYELPACVQGGICFTPGETCCENNREYICTQ